MQLFEGSVVRPNGWTDLNPVLGGESLRRCRVYRGDAYDALESARRFVPVVLEVLAVP